MLTFVGFACRETVGALAIQRPPGTQGDRVRSWPGDVMADWDQGTSVLKAAGVRYVAHGTMQEPGSSLAIRSLACPQ